jgi:hypothetical protein
MHSVDDAIWESGTRHRRVWRELYRLPRQAQEDLEDLVEGILRGAYRCFARGESVDDLCTAAKLSLRRQLSPHIR